MKAEIFIGPAETIKESLKKLDSSAEGVLLVVDEEKRLLGTLTDGDIRRSILKGHDINSTIEKSFNAQPHFLYKSDYSDSTIEDWFLKQKFELIPIVDDDKIVVDYLVWDHFFSEKQEKAKTREKLSVPVVIMAGGKGTRLAPFTNILPKPLIPIGEKTILELIIDEFRVFGITDFFMTLNYRGEMIRAYLDGIEKDFNVLYAWEKEFCGTAGSLTLLKDQLPAVFIVSNCDIIVKADYADVLKFHLNSKSDLTVISSIQHHKIPYGVVEFKDGGVVTGIREKPEFSFPINTGVYIVNRSVLALIPDGEVFHMTHLIEKAIKENLKVTTYPVNEKDYVDIGQWEEYRKALDSLRV